MSLRLRHGDRYLHHNFVVALLNDLFGIQARGGCSCAGPYGHRLLGIDLPHSDAFRDEIGPGCEGVKPGWTRINFNYFISDTVADYLIDAVDLIATDGHRLLADYRFDPHTGLWRHHRQATATAATDRPDPRRVHHRHRPSRAAHRRRGSPRRLPAPRVGGHGRAAGHRR